MSKPNNLLQGTLDILLLKMLALQPMSGWDIRRRLEHLSAASLQVSEGSLYPALHKLERRGLIAAQWRITNKNRRAKFYALTRSGHGHLESETGDWLRLSKATTAVLRLTEL